MTSTGKVLKSISAGFLLIPVLLGVTPAIAQDHPPSGTVSITATSVAAGVGVQWGEGILTFAGKQYPFSLQGLQIVGVGYSRVTAEGITDQRMQGRA
jgi:hypothetical protein